MVEKILNATTTQLYNRFENDYKYYVEDVEQHLSKPCFTIDVLTPILRSRSPVLYDRTMPMVIHFFTEDKKDTKKKCYAMAEQLAECLEYLPFENTILRGENISWDIVGEVLQFFITYRFVTRKVTTTADTMEEMVVSNNSHI